MLSLILAAQLMPEDLVLCRAGAHHRAVESAWQTCGCGACGAPTVASPHPAGDVGWVLGSRPAANTTCFDVALEAPAGPVPAAFNGWALHAVSGPGRASEPARERHLSGRIDAVFLAPPPSRAAISSTVLTI